MTLQKKDESSKDAGETRVLAIDNLHLHASDIDAVRRLAQTDPELAKIVVDQKDKFDARNHASYRFGVLVAALLVLGLVVSLSFVLVNLGLFLSAVLVMVLLVCALLVRVILTGEWSDTSAIGQLVGLITKSLGGSPKE